MLARRRAGQMSGHPADRIRHSHAGKISESVLVRILTVANKALPLMFRKIDLESCRIECHDRRIIRGDRNWLKVATYDGCEEIDVSLILKRVFEMLPGSL